MRKFFRSIFIVLLVLGIFNGYTHTLSSMYHIKYGQEKYISNYLKKTITNNNLKTPTDISDWLLQNITYTYDKEIHNKYDYWQTPIETVELKTGDCEDYAILSGELLKEIGVKSVLVGLQTSLTKSGHGICIFKYNSETYSILDCGNLKETPYRTIREIVVKEYKAYPIYFAMKTGGK